MNHTRWAPIFALLVAMSGCGEAPPPEPPSPPVLYTLPSFRLVNQDGEPFGTDRLKGKVWIADFVFSRCAGPCPEMQKRMREIQARLPEEVSLVSISVDPEYDTPEVLSRYAARYDARAGRWWFLTGKKEEVFDLSIKGFRLPAHGGEATDGALFLLHSELFVLVDFVGRIRGYYEGANPGVLDRLTRDAETLLKESP